MLTIFLIKTPGLKNLNNCKELAVVYFISSFYWNIFLEKMSLNRIRPSHIKSASLRLYSWYTLKYWFKSKNNICNQNNKGLILLSMFSFIWQILILAFRIEISNRELGLTNHWDLVKQGLTLFLDLENFAKEFI